MAHYAFGACGAMVVDFSFMVPWENWYHSTSHLFGAWLPGDPRGWRSRDHRYHCEGDYKRPPPKGAYDELFRRSKKLMKQDPVRLEWALRSFVLQMVVERLMSRGAEVQIAALDGIHLHVLHQCHAHTPKIELGSAKQYATAQLKARGFAAGLNLKIGEGIWARGSRSEPIAGSYHFSKATGYIRDHVLRGAINWEPAPFEDIPDMDLSI